MVYCNMIKTLLMPFQPSDDLALLCGVVLGDGSIEKRPRTELLRISCGYDHPALIPEFVSLVSRVFQKEPSITPRKNARCLNISLFEQGIATRLGLHTGAKKTWPSVPTWVTSTDRFARLFLRGLIETDGCVVNVYRATGLAYTFVTFTSVAPVIMRSFLLGTERLGYSFRLTRKGTCAILSQSDSARKFIAEAGVTKKVDWFRN